MLAAAIACVACVLAACGQTGALYQPPTQPETQTGQRTEEERVPESGAVDSDSRSPKSSTSEEAEAEGGEPGGL